MAPGETHMNIVFMGTPNFALCSLKALLENGHRICGVYTQPDKPKGRGYELQMSPVKAYAAEQHLPVFQPRTLRDPEVQSELRALCPDAIVVVAFGKILPPEVLAIPPLGCINVHGSLLPLYRGAAPMQRAILDGQKETGITTMYMAEGLDTGDMIFQTRVPILDGDNFESMHDKLALAGADLLIRTLQALQDGTAPRIPQPETGFTYAAKIEAEDCLLDFSRPARTLFNQIRGLSPYPLAYTRTPDGRRLKIVRATVLEETGSAVPGTVTRADKNGFVIACADASLLVEEVVPEGKGRMSAGAFVNGRKIQKGDKL